MEVQQVCKDGKHKFASTGEVTFSECPYCKTEMRLEVDTAEWKKSFSAKLAKGIKNGLSRGRLIDSLPRLPWFSEAIAEKINNPAQRLSHKEWDKKDDDELAGMFAENDIATYKVWLKVSSEIGRSLYAVERQLRIIMARREFELEEFYK